VLVTGGLGYIGSHTCVVLAEAGYDLGIVDNLANSKPAVLDRVRALARSAQIDFLQADVRDESALTQYLERGRFDCVIHFAGLKAVGESMEKPLEYYDNNVGGSIALLKAMKRCSVHDIVFSSSATVYGETKKLPLTEDHALGPINVYGQTKALVERILADHATADQGFHYAALRYFNPVGAHPSGTIGEDPRDIPNNLFPYIAQVATGRRPALRVWGNDYPTRDGTGVRDYVHVMDLARAHLAALDYLERRRRSIVANVGTGRGYSVLEAVKAYEKASGRRVPLEFHPRRAGDLAENYADPALAQRELKWQAELDLDAMCADSWRWQSANPQGYG
jgi:UDP-glucose 4-epimerase